CPSDRERSVRVQRPLTVTVVSKEPLPPSHSCSTRITRLYCRGRVSVSMAVCTVSGVTA
ncbi:DUF1292 domain-containing protein, partial [Dysosmobacter welbionis]